MNEVFQRTVLSNNVLNTPWEVTYGPDGYLWITESQGYKAYRMDPNTGATTTILDISKGSTSTELTTNEHNTFNAQFNASDLNGISGTWYTKVPWPQGGFAGLAIHPQFNSGKPYVYISYVHKFDSASITSNGGYYYKNSIVRFTYNSGTGKLESPITICDTLPGSSDHNSQRMIIAPVVKNGTDYLFYGQGEMGAGQLVNQWRPNYAQDTGHYHGKILRFNLEPDGDADTIDQWIPNDNPYCKTRQSAVWCIGFRNNQGFAYDTTYGVLYGSSHGPYSDDEINIIQRYKNYGHPLVEGYAADGNYNGTKTPGLKTSYTAGVPYSTSTGLSTLSPIGDEQHNADSITASGYASYKDPLFSAYPGPDASTGSSLSIDSIWRNTTGANANWPSEAWSGLDIYKNTVIPGWKNSLVACGLKWGRLLRLKLGTGNSTIVPTNGADTVAYFQGKNRYRDIAFNPNGKDMYVSMESSTSSGPAAGVATVPQCTNCVIKYTFLGYADNGGKSSIPDAIDVTDTSSLSYSYINTVDSATTITIDNTNNNIWVPITGPDGNILAEIYANGNNLGTVKTAFYKHAGGNRISNGIHYLNRNITITPQTQPSTPVKVRFYLTQSEYDTLHLDGLSGVSSISNLKILKNEDACGAAIQSTTTLFLPKYEEAHGTSGYMLQSDSIPHFSSFYFANANIALPLNLLSFKGSLQNNNTVLDWQTTNEINTSEFVIERGIDGKNFQQIGITAAKGSTNKNSYTFTDYGVTRQSSLILYYRLKMVDKDGHFIYSDVVIITLPAVTGKITVFPNPTHNEFNVSISSTTDSKIQWSMTDNAGRVVMQNSVDVKKGVNSITISTEKLSTGFYFLSVSGGGFDEKIKLEKL
jgi:glucose/arabinose dehydrogenase